MTYFELFEIPVTFQPDKPSLKTKFYELSRRHHPDMFATASEKEQAEALEKSSLLNKAYKTLQNEDDTIKYVLSLHNLIEEEEKYELSPDFLMEVMELNEELMELEAGDAQKKLDNLFTEIYKNVEEIIKDYQGAAGSQEKLLRVKDYHYKKKYLKRILDRIDGMRNIASRS